MQVDRQLISEEGALFMASRVLIHRVACTTAQASHTWPQARWMVAIIYFSAAGLLTYMHYRRSSC